MAVGTSSRPASPSVIAGELFLGVALLGLAAIAGYALIRRPWANRLDAAGFAAIPADPNDLLYHRIAEIGTLPVLLSGIGLAIVLSIWRDWPRAVACILGPLAAVLVTEHVAKPLVGRHLVAFGGDSYPSGTVTATAALVTVITLAAPVLLRPLFGLAGLAVIGAVSVAVVGMRWHFPSDAIGGTWVGVGAVLSCDALVHIPRTWIAWRATRERSPGLQRLDTSAAR